MSRLGQSVRLHHGAVRIHPFQNGNGRWSGIVGNIRLRVNNHPVVEWPEGVIGAVSPIREGYLYAVRRADEHDFGVSINLHGRSLSEPS